MLRPNALPSPFRQVLIHTPYTTHLLARISNPISDHTATCISTPVSRLLFLTQLPLEEGKGHYPKSFLVSHKVGIN
jgi:hypothetical protein